MAGEGAAEWVDRYAGEPRKGADILVQCLEREGVRTLFAYPGGASMEIHQALTRSSSIRNILCRHEQVRPRRCTCRHTQQPLLRSNTPLATRMIVKRHFNGRGSCMKPRCCAIGAGRDLCSGGLCQDHRRGGRLHCDLRSRRHQPGHRPRGRPAGLDPHGRNHWPGAPSCIVLL